MAITRRIARFRELAQRTDTLCTAEGLDVPAGLVDRLLNHHIETTALLLRISPRAALIYTPNDLPDTLTVALTAALTVPLTREGRAVTEPEPSP